MAATQCGTKVEITKTVRVSWQRKQHLIRTSILIYIDCCIKHLNGGNSSDNIVNEMVEGRILCQWREYGELINEDDVYCFEFMENCYNRGREDAELYSHFGSDDHHIYDQIPKVLVKVITIVMNYEEEEV